MLIAAGSWKEGPSADKVCELIQQGLSQVRTEGLSIEVCPLADGGTGLTDLVLRAAGGKRHQVQVTSPHFGPRVTSSYVVTEDGLCAIESASAAGLALVPVGQRDPRHTTTRGVGETVLKAFDAGERSFLIGCGDSSTNDCGMGFAAALGVQFTDDFGAEVPPQGLHLGDVRGIQYSDRALRIREEATFEVACNPNSILCGPQGTTRIYAPQKGASPEAVQILEAGLESFVELVEAKTSKQLRFLPGAGGAGGLASAIYALFDGRLTFSFDIVRRFLDLDSRLRQTDLVIVAEGLFDSRTLTGKLPCSVALYAKRFGLPVAAIVGGLEDDLELLYYNGVDAVEVATKRPADLSRALENADTWIPDASARLLRKIDLGGRIAGGAFR